MHKVTGKLYLNRAAMLLSSAVVLALLLGALSCAGASVTITTPNTVLKDGDTCSSGYTAGGFADMTVELSYDGGNTWEAPPVYEGPVSGALNPLPWTVPVSLFTSRDCMLKITCSTGGSSDFGTSGLFTIDNSLPDFVSGPTVVPNGWTDSDSVQISWAPHDVSSSAVTSEYRVDSSDDADYSPNDSPLTLDVQSMGLADGKHRVDIRLTDEAGNATTSSVDVYVDRTAPNAFNPTAGPDAWTKGTVRLTFSTTDPGDRSAPQTGSGVDHYTVSVDGVDYGDQVSPFDLDVSAYSTGTYTAHVTAVDAAGNERTGYANIQVDNDPPSPFDATPDATDWTKNNVNVSFLTSDPTPGSGVIDHYEVSVDGGPYEVQSSPYSMSLEGAHTVLVRALDGAKPNGNVRQCNSPVYTLIDRTAPSLDGYSSWAGTNAGDIGVDYTVSDNASGIKRVALWYKNGTAGVWTYSGLTSGSTSNTFFFQNNTGGAYYFGFVIEDNAGNVAASNTGNGVCSTTLDTEGPTFDSIVATPHYAKAGTEVTITFTASEELIDDPYLGVGPNDGSLASSSGQDYTFTYTVQPDDLEGTADIYIEGIDLASNYNWTDNYDQLTIDMTPPDDFTPTASPSAWSGASSIEVSFEATDSGSGIDHYEIAVDNGTYSTDASPCNVSASGLSDGPHTVHVKAIDGAGNELTKDVAINVDKTAPADFAPAANPGSWTNANSVGITFGTTDARSGIDRYEVALDGGAFSTHSSPYVLDVTGVADGTHTVHVKAIDNAGNERAKDVTIRLDKTGPAPFVPVSSPTDWTGASTVQITWSAADADAGIDHCEVALGNGAYSTQTSPYTLNVTGLAAGTYTVHVKAVDLVGNSTVGSVTAQVTPSATPITASLTVIDPTPSLGRQFDYILWKNWMGNTKATQNTYDVKWAVADSASVVTSVLIEYRAGTSGQWSKLVSSTKATGVAHLNVTFLPETDNCVFRITCGDRAGNSAIVFSSPFGIYDAARLIPTAQVITPADGTSFAVGATLRVTAQESMPVFRDPRNPARAYKDASPDWWFAKHSLGATPRLTAYKKRGDGKPTGLHKTLLVSMPRRAPQYIANTDPTQTSQFLSHVLVNTWQTDYVLKKTVVDARDVFQAELRYSDIVSVGNKRQPDKSSKLVRGIPAPTPEPMAKTLNQYEFTRFSVN